MSFFTDRLARNWNLPTMSLGECRRIREATGVSLSAPEDVVGLCELFTERERFGELLWFMCKAEAERRGVDQVDFLSGLDADTIEAAWSALVEAFAEFQPANGREGVKQAARQYLEAMAASSKAISAEMARPEFVDQLHAKVSAMVRDTFRESLVA